VVKILLRTEQINTAHRLARFRVEGGGAGLAMRTVQSLLGMNVDYYALNDFAASNALSTIYG
jgi:anionic cell wall polymer biosynthesis LytR-Cps2A-Psr (LCP) family protein